MTQIHVGVKRKSNVNRNKASHSVESEEKLVEILVVKLCMMELHSNDAR